MLELKDIRIEYKSQGFEVKELTHYATTPAFCFTRQIYSSIVISFLRSIRHQILLCLSTENPSISTEADAFFIALSISIEYISLHRYSITKMPPAFKHGKASLIFTTEAFKRQLHRRTYKCGSVIILLYKPC